MNVPSEEELMALFEQGGIEAVAAHAKAAADRDCNQILETFLNTKKKERRRRQMKVEITYYRTGDLDTPIGAKTEVMGEILVGLGKTVEESKERLIAKADALLNQKLPPPETVEIPYGNEEMETEFVITKDVIPWGSLETREPVRRAKVHFEGCQVVTPKDREIEAGTV